MEHRQLGASGLRVPVLTLGTATFGGRDGYETWGKTDLREAQELVDACIEAGVTMFDTADSYSLGWAEEILGQALTGRREDVLIATKASDVVGPAPHEGGSSRLHLIRAVDKSLARLGTDYIDLLYMHLFDATTPVEEVVSTLNEFVASGKVRYVAASNFSGWHLMKSLAIADRYGWPRYIGHQVQYSLAVRHYEFELRQLGAEEGVGAVIWSPLAMSALTGKVRRNHEIPADSRLSHWMAINVPATGLEKIHEIVDVLDAVAAETGKTLSQVAINWLLQKPTVCSVVIGARTLEQLRENIGSTGWELNADQMRRLDAASAAPATYPFSHQLNFPQFLPDVARSSAPDTVSPAT